MRYELGLTDDMPRRVVYTRGTMSAKTFTRTFPNATAMERWEERECERGVDIEFQSIEKVSP